MFYRTAILTAFASLVCFPLTSKADTCIPLSLVGGEGNKVTKTVSHPNIPGPRGIRIARNNWNTDWAVPGGQIFNRFVATITSEEDHSFNIRMYLKYSDDTSTKFYDSNNVQINPQNPLTVEENVAEKQPYQVNVFVGGLPNIGKTYTASVVGCY